MNPQKEAPYEGAGSNIAIAQDQATSMLAIIANAAKDPNIDVAKMERLMEMKLRMDAISAEEQFNQAMNHAQKKTSRIQADANNNQTRSKYATYAALDRALRPVYTECGFSLSFDTGEACDGMVRVLCYVSHTAGHTRTYRADIPADGKGAKGGDVMTKTHAVGSGMSYGMRYLLKMIFNVAIGEDDDDGNSASGHGVSGQELDWMEKIHAVSDLNEYKATKAELVKSYGMVDKVPRRLVEACNIRFHQLKDAS